MGIALWIVASLLTLGNLLSFQAYARVMKPPVFVMTVVMQVFYVVVIVLAALRLG